MVSWKTALLKWSLALKILNLTDLTALHMKIFLENFIISLMKIMTWLQIYKNLTIKLLNSVKDAFNSSVSFQIISRIPKIKINKILFINVLKKLYNSIIINNNLLIVNNKYLSKRNLQSHYRKIKRYNKNIQNKTIHLNMWRNLFMIIYAIGWLQNTKTT